ncbi:MAG TPA: DUF2127 domain-containing protein [Candidatus Kapabacteria bacterium]|nr:DUF2127 domain-containing protein [Candidatus Kapabacteria bacterium]
MSRATGDFLIGIFKLAKATLLLLVAAGALSLLDNKIRDVVERHITQLSGDAHFHALEKVAGYLGFATTRRIEFVSGAAFFYAALFAIEGIGLLAQKRWAEYFTAIITASFLPIEIYEIFRHPMIFRVIVFAINVAVLIYLIWRVRGQG